MESGTLARESREADPSLTVLGGGEGVSESVACLLRRLEAEVATVPLSILPRVALGLSGIQGAVAARLLGEVQFTDPAKDRGPGPLISVKDAASRLGVTPQWLYKNPRAAGLLVRLSTGTVRVSVRQLERFISRNSGRL